MMSTFRQEYRKQRTPHPVSYRQRQTWGDPGTQSHGTSSEVSRVAEEGTAMGRNSFSATISCETPTASHSVTALIERPAEMEDLSTKS